MPRVALHTLGCKLNYAESGSMGRELERAGFEIVPFGHAADLVVVNTCAVTAEAERKCRQVVRRAVAARPGALVVVTGCYAQLRPDELAAIDGVDLVLGAREKADISRWVAGLSKRERVQVEVSCMDGAPFSPAHSDSHRTRAFMKVQDGCDYACSFCTIPAARGPSRSHAIAAAVREAESIARTGVREIVLSGVNIGLFGADSGESLAELVRALDRVEGVARFRISSIEPNLLTDELIDVVASSRAFQPHFHVPLQSGDDDVLGAMRRRYRSRVFEERVERILRAVPGAGIGADVIVGFPAETRERFGNTLRFLRDLPLSYLHVFTYSERPGTAAGAGPQVAVPERSRRNAVLRLVSEHMRSTFASSFEGTLREVLWERADPAGRAEGFTGNYIRVRGRAGGHARGTISRVRLGRAGADGIVEEGTAAPTDVRGSGHRVDVAGLVGEGTLPVIS